MFNQWVPITYVLEPLEIVPGHGNGVPLVKHIIPYLTDVDSSFYMNNIFIEESMITDLDYNGFFVS